ncbi:SAM-dependent DNA methyltransferase [Candidatus Woesearchaeota archaeon]|nr:SAM-dependent DNA methyltransferase [Candidatus Woesearchaeota archaeon]
MLAQELKGKISKLWDKFWAGGLANPLTAIEQISYLIFMKRLEDLDNLEVKRSEARKEKYISVFEGNEDCRWSHWKHFNADEMIVHVRDKVFPFLKNIKKGEDGEFSKQMQDAIFLIPKPSLLQEAVSIIDELNITARNQDTQGDIYEFLLSELNQAGKAGQFRTPRHIIRMMVELLNPQLGEKICDPACGTAGFLINAYQYLLKMNTSSDLIKFDNEGVAYNLIGDKIVDKQHWNLLRRQTLYGFDFDPTMVRIASMNMILHGVEHPNIKRFDTLSKGFEHKADYDVILANPPFTGSIDASDINNNFKVGTTKTELLFLELFYNLLSIGGRCAVIVPNGVLFGSSNAHIKVRQLLLEKCQMEAVISMPSGVFKPYSGVGTAILIFTKGGKTSNVWFYDMKSDGFSLDDKRDIVDGKGDIPDIVERFKNRQSGENSIIVSFDDIKNNDYNLSISRYKEVKHEDVVYQKPELIIEGVLKKEKEIANELKSLHDGLTRGLKKGLKDGL